MKIKKKTTVITVAVLALPLMGRAQDPAGYIGGLHGVLDTLYEEMMPLCSQLIGVGRGLAGFAALWYIASRVWRHLANAEPIDFYPLFRPFAIGLCVLMFPSVLAVINGVMKPTVTATAVMMDGSNRAIAVLLEQREQAIRESKLGQIYIGETGEGNREEWYRYTYDQDPSDEGWVEGLGNDIKFAMSKALFNFRNSIKEWMSEVLRVLFEAAALCIDTLRTFQLVVLAILGPLVFGLSVFDGFQHTLTVWLARYINIFLWLPIANIFGSIIGKIQENMIRLDLSQIDQSGDTFFSSSDIGYLIFMIIGIVGYFTVPSVANYIVHAGGGGALGQKVTSFFGGSARTVLNTSARGLEKDAMGNPASIISQGMAGHGMTSPYFNDKLKGND